MTTVAFSDLDTWLGEQPDNTASTPYELEITGLTVNDIGDSRTSGTLGYIIRNHSTKFVDLNYTETPYGLTNMDYCFYQCQSLVRGLKLNEGITSFSHTFQGCWNLSSEPAIGGDVESLEYCFESCSGLISAMLTYVNSVDSMKSCYSNCQYITNADLGHIKSVQTMENCFGGCISLVTANLPKSVNNMHGCLSSCRALVSPIELPRNVTTLNGCFSGCTSLTVAPVIPDTVTDLTYAFTNTAITTAPSIPESVLTMERCFSGCGSLSTAPVLPKHVTKISYCFQNCASLITPPEIPNTVTSMSSCFWGCTSLTSAPRIPDSVRYMGGAFGKCSSLTIVPNVPKNLLEIGQCFTNCTSLEEISMFEADLESMVNNNKAQQVFSGCTSLTKIGIKSDLAESEDWHVFKLTFDSNSVQGEVYDKNRTAVAIQQTQVTKSTLRLPVKTDELWFPTGYTDAEIDAIIEKAIQYRYSYFNNTNILNPENKNFVLWADDPNKISTNFKSVGVSKIIPATTSDNLVEATIGDNDFVRLRAGGNSNAGFVALETADDGTEDISVAQYTGTFQTEVRRAYLLNGNGNSSFPGSVTATGGFVGNLTGSADTASASNAISYTGTGVSCITANQTADSYYGASSWASYLIFNHGNGSNYYHQMIRMPFWGAPQYQRMEGGTLTGWKDFVTSENIGSQSVSRATYASGADSPFIINADGAVGNFDEGIRINQNIQGWSTLLIGSDRGTTSGPCSGFWFGVNRAVYGNILFLNFNTSSVGSYFVGRANGTVYWHGDVDGIVTRDSGGGWINGRDNCVVRQTKQTQSQGSSWNPVIGVKTWSGHWSMGTVGGESLMLSYDTDYNYSIDNNTSAVINFPTAGRSGTIALTSDNVASADWAGSAGSAGYADSAGSAGYADSAGSAGTAGALSYLGSVTHWNLTDVSSSISYVRFSSGFTIMWGRYPDCGSTLPFAFSSTNSYKIVNSFITGTNVICETGDFVRATSSQTIGVLNHSYTQDWIAIGYS